MARARLIQTDYSEFRRNLRECSSRGAVLRPADAEQWQEHVREHKINEFAALAIAKARFESPVPVILRTGDACDGYYIYSEDAEACLRLVSLE